MLLRKLVVQATQLTLTDCYLPEKPTGPHNYAQSVPTVVTKGANSDLKIASAIIFNKRITTYRVIKFFAMNHGNYLAFRLVTYFFYLILLSRF